MGTETSGGTAQDPEEIAGTVIQDIKDLKTCFIILNLNHFESIAEVPQYAAAPKSLHFRLFTPKQHPL